ncbi:DUF6265 family protein [Mucilaginibacter antarcticus]|uniref:DUF6265 family protein n=1 Tax=Mucilaginibacter antarcticus TaxID=1855725 RepID=A0ABW5XRQ4_9SPHI
MRYIFAFLVLLAAFINNALAQTAKGGSFADIAFIEGHWKASPAEGRTIEAVWVAPAGDNIVGFMRMMNGDKIDVYEILAYEQSAQGLVSFVKHFKPGLIGQEEKESPNKYIFVDAAKDRAIFKTPNDDLRILYEKRSANQFAIARGNLENGKWIFKDLFVFNRVK